MIRRIASIGALVGAAGLALFGTTRPLSHLSIALTPDEPRKDFITTGWRTDFAGTVDQHSPLFGVPVAVAVLVIAVALAWPRQTKRLAFAGSALLAGVLGMLLVYLGNAIRFHREGNLAIDPGLQAGFGDGVWFLASALLIAVLGTVLHPTRARRASPVPRAP
ncbi:hypothetical protein Lesp02_67470 [Lentzea sp. NBRC 105346]|uniref:hypothetical protein n=1 Tax=Lentzea sp. NBRC 105346 TaxID=3032205 RepID=UPI0024A28824|nr:hypothetical protein [Lentzea sp. NBRC 105346]GLZ34560.1 hypothetical protein Lesp02_67470 [Lentzea sp. NBRC 105346]